MLDLILKIATSGTLLVGATAIYIAVRNNSRQLAAQIFLAYSDRVRQVRNAAGNNLDRPQTILDLTYLIFEFHSLRRRGYVPDPVWQIWEADMTELLNTPAFLGLLPDIRRRFENHSHFLTWIGERHRVQSNARTLPDQLLNQGPSRPVQQQRSGSWMSGAS